MKTNLLFLYLYLPASLEAATVVITVAGRVSEITVATPGGGPAVVVGDRWVANITYDYPTLPSVVFIEGPLFMGLNSRFELSVASLFWTGQLTVSAFGEWIVGPQVFMSGASPAPLEDLPPGSTNTVMSLHWTGPSDMIRDWTTLPSSFEQWNLPAATSFSMSASRYSAAGGPSDWVIHSNSLETVSILFIPEPGSAVLASFAALTALTRRRRVRV